MSKNFDLAETSKERFERSYEFVQTKVKGLAKYRYQFYLYLIAVNIAYSFFFMVTPSYMLH